MQSLEFAPLAITLIALPLAFYYGTRLRKHEKQCIQLGEAIKSIYSADNAVPQGALNIPILKEIYQFSLSAIEATTASSISRDTGHLTALKLSERLAQTTTPDETMEELATVIMIEGRPYIRAVGIIHRNSSDNPTRVAKLVGIPDNRITDCLVNYAEELFQECTGPARWGYFYPDSGSLYDYSAFGIGLQLCLKLRNSNGLCGALWVGICKGTSISHERREVIRAVCQHAASCLYAAEKASQDKAETAKERDFLLGLSHDLRAPGNSALFALELLAAGEHGSLTPEQLIQLERAKRNISEQLAIVGDVLNFAKHQKGLLQANKEQIAVAGLVRKVIEKFRSTPIKPEVAFICEHIPNWNVYADPGHLTRILDNFLSNAKKYTDEGIIRLSFGRSSRHIDISVEDTGIGVPPGKDQDSIFEPFVRASNVELREGVGVGLPITKILAELNGGQVFYRPKGLHGSIFGVRLPLGESQPSKRPPSNTVKTILVADDDQGVRSILRHQLSDIAAQVLVAHDIASTVEILQKSSPDLLVLDMHFRDGNGCEILSKWPHIATVVFSGQTTLGQSELEQSRKNLVLVEKPSSVESLTLTIARLLESQATKAS